LCSDRAKGHCGVVRDLVNLGADIVLAHDLAGTVQRALPCEERQSVDLDDGYMVVARSLVKRLRIDSGDRHKPIMADWPRSRV
jgi:hypothetical protein